VGRAERDGSGRGVARAGVDEARPRGGVWSRFRRGKEGGAVGTVKAGGVYGYGSGDLRVRGRRGVEGAASAGFWRRERRARGWR
jgi:hypothetical protein